MSCPKVHRAQCARCINVKSPLLTTNLWHPRLSVSNCSTRDRFQTLLSPYDTDGDQEDDELVPWWFTIDRIFQSNLIAEPRALNEALAYEKLRPVQGTVIPWFYGIHQVKGIYLSSVRLLLTQTVFYSLRFPMGWFFMVC